MNLEINQAYKTLIATRERKQEEFLRQRWIPYQSEMSFDSFKAQIMSSNEVKYDNRSTEEILKNVKSILDQGGVHGTV